MTLPLDSSKLPEQAILKKEAAQIARALASSGDWLQESAARCIDMLVAALDSPVAAPPSEPLKEEMQMQDSVHLIASEASRLQEDSPLREAGAPNYFPVLPEHAATIFDDGFWLRNKIGPLGTERFAKCDVYTAEQIRDCARIAFRSGVAVGGGQQVQEDAPDNRTRPLTDQSQPWTPEHCKAYPRRASEEIEYLRGRVASLGGASAQVQGDARTPFTGPKEGCEHDWRIWPETDGQEQHCLKCGSYRRTPEEDKFWVGSADSTRGASNG